MRIIGIGIVGALMLAGCAQQESTPAATAPGAPQFVVTANTMQLMTWILDPRADVVWGSVGTVVTDKGEEKLVPKTDAEWNEVRDAAATVAEITNLLMLPPHVRDQGDWASMARKVIEKANKCVEAAEAKDAEALFTDGGDLYLACVACHAKYIHGEELPPEEQVK